FLQGWGTAVETAPREVTSFMMMGASRSGNTTVAQVTVAVDSSDPDTIIEWLQPFAELAPLLDQSVSLTSYAAILSNSQDARHDGQGEPVARSALVEHITPEFAAAAAELIESGALYFFQIRSVGGAVQDVDSLSTAYAGRSANFSVIALGASRARLNTEWDKLQGHFSGLYLSFESDQSQERIFEAFPPPTLARLREAKLRYDPDNVFRDNFNITPPIALAAS
ncbi:MAG: BBE domain-containing protein, partial [Lacisediminihabitans sp.]